MDCVRTQTPVCWHASSVLCHKAYCACRVWIHVYVFVTSQVKENQASPLSIQVVTFHRLLCLYLRQAFYSAKPKHRFENGVARETACFEIGDGSHCILLTSSLTYY